eukprot:c27251_g1_i3 orf=421-2409(+)
MPTYPGASRSKLGRERMEKTSWKSRIFSRCFAILLSIAFWWLLFVFHFSIVGQNHENLSALNSSDVSEIPLIQVRQTRESLRSKLSLTPEKLSSPQAKRNSDQILKKYSSSLQPFWRALSTINNKSDPCAGKYVYMHELPPEFNQKMLEDCRRLSLWTNMCKFTTNAGLGPPLEDSESVFTGNGWFATNQFAVDVIFHNRMKQYECLTMDSRKAALLYVPFYAGLDISRHLWGANVSVRDSGPLSLASWLQSQPEWEIMRGRDHFLVGGRITWDFRRLTDADSDWGNKLLRIPAIMNMTMLVIEASPFHTNDFGIPYPTYFHPSQDSDVIEWQNKVRMANRSVLFSFAGAPRPEIATSIRGQIMDQCKFSKFCKLLECDKGESKCHSPSTVMQLFQQSVFCLQPQGDSFTRRSIFDSMLAGCIPVFFHSDSAYSQYIWHLPQQYNKYSVFIHEDDVRERNASIEAILLHIPSGTIQKMKEEVISLIPGLVYADPRHHLTNMKDAFDITVKALIDKVTNLRVRITEGKEEEDLDMAVGSGEVHLRGEMQKDSEQAARRWEGQRRNGEEWLDSSPPPFFQTGQNRIEERKAGGTIVTSLEEIWRRDQAEKEAHRKSHDIITPDSSLYLDPQMSKGRHDLPEVLGHTSQVGKIASVARKKEAVAT